MRMTHRIPIERCRVCAKHPARRSGLCRACLKLYDTEEMQQLDWFFDLFYGGGSDATTR